MSIQTKSPTQISPHLQDLIDAANNSIQTIKEQILEIYETAKNEGFTPQEARILIEEKVVKASDRYIRLVLPDEAKDSKFANKKKVDFDTEDFENGDENEPEAELIPPNKVPKIPTAYEINDAESVEEELHDIPEPIDEPYNVTIDDIHTATNDEMIKLRDQIQQLTEENTRLRIQKIGTISNKFDFEYDFEMPSGSIVPFIITVFPDKKDGYIRLNKTKISENEKKEAKRK